MNYFISDLHFGHYNVIKFDNRPYATVEEMDNALITNWNNVVTNNDKVYILGDFSWYKADETYNILKQLKGRKRLIKGNHDRFLHNSQCKNQFENISDYEEINENSKLIVLSHYPIMFWKNQYGKSIHLYGHVHTTNDYTMLQKFIRKAKSMNNPCIAYNVGCMMPYMGYTPRTLNEIISEVI